MKRKMLFGTRAAGATFSVTGTTAAKDLNSAIQTQTGGVIFRCSTGALTGSPTLDIDIEDSEDGVNFAKVCSFTQITAAGTGYVKDPGVRIGRFVRAVMTLGSTTSFATVRVWAEYDEDRSSGRPAGGVLET